MTQDVSYQPAVYRKQGGNELVVGSTGTLTIASGGSINVESGGAMTLASGSLMTIADGAAVAAPVTVMATTSGTITNAGITTFGTTIASAYTLTNPTAGGVRKALFCTIHGATTVNQVITTASTLCTIIGSSKGPLVTVRTLTFTNAGQGVVLTSISSTAWFLESNINTVALTS